MQRDNNDIFWLFAILLLAVAVRLWCTVGQSITFDEHYELKLAQQAPAVIIAKADGFPPAYAFLLKLWFRLFDSHSGRTLSILLGVVACAASYFLGLEVANRKLALWLATITAILPIHVYYTSEARAYALLLVLTTLAMWFLLRATRSNKMRDWVLFSLAAACGHYTHYLFVIFVAMCLIYVWGTRPSWKPVIAGALIAIMTLPLTAACLPADLAMQQGLPYQTRFGASELAFTYGSFLTGYTLGPSLSDLHGMSPKEAVMQILPWAIVIAASLAGLLWFGRKEARILPARQLGLLCFLSLGPCALGALCLTANLSYHPRYALWSIVPLTLLGAIFASNASEKKIGRISTLALLICFAVAIWNRSALDRYRNEDLQSAAQFIANTDPNDLPIIVISGYMVEPLSYSFSIIESDAPASGLASPATDKEDIPTEAKRIRTVGANRFLYSIPMNAAIVDREEEMRQNIELVRQDSQTAWLVYTRAFHEDPEHHLFEMIQAAGDVSHAKTFAGLDIYTVEFRSAGQ